MNSSMKFTVQPGAALAFFVAALPHALAQDAFAFRHLSEITTHQIRLIDLNHDGKADLVAGAYAQGSLVVALGDGQGAFGSELLLPLNSPSVPVGDIAFGDFDGDGHRDIAVAMSSPSYGVRVFLGDGSGQFAPGVALTPTPTASCLAAADLDLDGKDDLVWGDAVSNHVVVLLASGGGAFTPGVPYSLAAR